MIVLKVVHHTLMMMMAVMRIDIMVVDETRLTLTLLVLEPEWRAQPAATCDTR